MSWPAMVAAHATVPEAGGRDCTWPLISTCTAVRKGAAKEAGNPERGVDHDRLRPWYTAVTRRGRPSRPGWPHRSSACRIFAQGPSGATVEPRWPRTAVRRVGAAPGVLDAVADAGFTVDRVAEPQPSAEALRLFPHDLGAVVGCFATSARSRGPVRAGQGGGQAGLCGQPGGSPLWGQPGGSLLCGQTEAGRARLAGQQPGILLIECPAIDEVFQLPLTAHSEAFVLDHSRNRGCYATRSTITCQLPCAGDTDASGQPLMPSGRGVRHGCLPLPRRQGSRAAALAGAQPGLDRRRQTDLGSLTGSQRPQARRRSARLDRARIFVPNGPVPALAPPSA